MRAEVFADNISIRVSWEWSCQGMLDLVRVHYQPEGGSPMMYTVDNTTATSATLPNLQCNTKYTIWVHARGSRRRALSTTVSLPARGMFMLKVVILLEQVPPECFLYQQEVCTCIVIPSVVILRQTDFNKGCYRLLVRKCIRSDTLTIRWFV